jgi:4-carboxymuconolactone decarboxylase
MAPVGEPNTPYHEAVLDFVAAEVWARPVLSRRERRWITLTCAAMAGQITAVQAHVRSAVDTGDISLEELAEFALHFAVYAGWPLGSLVQNVINEMADRV